MDRDSLIGGMLGSQLVILARNPDYQGVSYDNALQIDRRHASVPSG